MDKEKQWVLRRVKKEELDQLYTTRMEEDFPSAERPSLPAMQRHLREDLQEIWIMADQDGEEVAYAACAQARGIVLVTLLAVFAEHRGGGHGTTLLELLQAHYAAERAVLLEVEDPQEAADEEDLLIRQRRIAFYERNGYRMLSGIDHVSFGIRLLLMALPLEDSFENIRRTAVEDVREVYHIILPPERWERVITKEAGGASDVPQQP